ncbi:DNA polymerase III subunit chi [Methylomonas paludis]|uniref:DNA polymerase III subunit chi n=1 Tax=Methylomonas paludis TaxID=1173101 RepID=A0A975R9Z2_9GAMM|nr:DNA polymerase III subunit chi [Methylomonas paludis]QWF70788.1 DNA polymerase III subunit chi [Methylomonas paludis]
MSENHSNLPVVDFYVLATHLQQQRQDFACKLIEKIYRSGQNCYVLTDSLEQAASIDLQLWTFRAGSFIPHQIYRGILPELPQTILIGLADIPESRQNLIVNLSSQLPEHGPLTGRILEVLDNSEICKQAGRERFRYYRQLGITPVTHKL